MVEKVKNTKKVDVSKKENEVMDQAKEKFEKISHEAKERLDEASKVMKKEAKVIEKKGKKMRGSFTTWWENSSVAERVSMILGIIFLAIALVLLRKIIFGVVILLLGLGGVTGFFVNKEK